MTNLAKYLAITGAIVGTAFGAYVAQDSKIADKYLIAASAIAFGGFMCHSGARIGAGLDARREEIERENKKDLTSKL